MDYDLQSEKQRIAEATEEIKKELSEKWQKHYTNAQIFPPSLSSINPELITLLLSFQNTLFYNDLARKFNLSQPQRDNLPKIVWHICLNKKWEQLKVSIADDLSVDAFTADQITTTLNQTIFLRAQELSTRRFIPKNALMNFQKESISSQPISLPINDALKNYPELGEQLVTNEKIALKTFHESVRPSIKNWLADYTFTMGYEYKSAIERGNYLFQSINGRRLNSLERQKLSYLLKAHDENSTVTINKDSKQLIFPASDIEPAKTSPSQVPNPKPVMQNTGKIAASHNFSPNNGGLPRNDSYTKPQNNSPVAPKQELTRNDSYKISQLKDSNIKFSSPQKLPYEKETAPTTPAYKPAKPEPMRIKPHTEINDNYFSDRNSGKPLNNVVNLKEE